MADGYIILKKGLRDLKSLGIVFLQDEVAKLLPHLKDRVHELKDWKQCGVLKVDMGPLERWHREGLLLIGDAAHIMSPVGGVGINYAIQDAIAAARAVTAGYYRRRTSALAYGVRSLLNAAGCYRRGCRSLAPHLIGVFVSPGGFRIVPVERIKWSYEAPPDHA
ncbi:MAG TPA: hypothetical protein EYQ50_04975 [Verrucomicrobiales bacterium]|nr:hypothetical protein [Verrucomicrobiales bacterium]